MARDSRNGRAAPSVPGHSPEKYRSSTTQAQVQQSPVQRSSKATSVKLSIAPAPPRSSISTSESATQGQYQLQPWEGTSQLVDGVNYFKVGEFVDFRRWDRKNKTYSKWLPGKVINPTDNMKGERCYIISWWDVMTQDWKQCTCTPSLDEIRALSPDAAMPARQAHSATPANANLETAKLVVQKDTVLFVLLSVLDGSKTRSIWTPAICLGVEKPHGYRVRVTAGPLKNQVFDRVQEIMPHTAEVAMDLRKSGQTVETSGL
ncbi:hypothetical protein B0H34DRAFT_715943 [Crassisporium funariophilum]|nr:hypothetical protein B0H34DRAFT_715943 [Crassisporium funariophilum]